MKQNDGFLIEAIFLFEQLEILNVSIFVEKKATQFVLAVFSCDFAHFCAFIL